MFDTILNLISLGSKVKSTQYDRIFKKPGDLFINMD